MKDTEPTITLPAAKPAEKIAVSASGGEWLDIARALAETMLTAAHSIAFSLNATRDSDTIHAAETSEMLDALMTSAAALDTLARAISMSTMKANQEKGGSHA